MIHAIRKLRSSPIGNEGFAHPSASRRRSKTKLALQQFCPSINHVNKIKIKANDKI